MVVAAVFYIDFSSAKLPGERSCNGQNTGTVPIPAASNPVAVPLPPAASATPLVPAAFGQLAIQPPAPGNTQGIDVRSPGADADSDVAAAGSMSLPVDA